MVVDAVLTLDGAPSVMAEDGGDEQITGDKAASGRCRTLWSGYIGRQPKGKTRNMLCAKSKPPDILMAKPRLQCSTL
jgi:hypothetical protein